jgi:hypothetical protein
MQPARRVFSRLPFLADGPLCRCRCGLPAESFLMERTDILGQEKELA